MGLKEKELLVLLRESPAVQRMIRSICGADESATNMKADVSAPATGTQSNKLLSNYQNEIDQLKLQLNQAHSELQKYKNDVNELQGEVNAYAQKNGALNNEIIELRRNLLDQKTQLEATLVEKKKLECQYDALREENQKLVSELNLSIASLKKIQEQFEKPVSYLEMYHQLSESTKDGLSDIICDKSVILFIASCSDADNLKKIWEYTREMISNGQKQEDVDTLNKIFDYFFWVYNESLSTPIYERDTVEIGDIYDDDTHTRSRDSATSGYITEILLCGYRSINTGYAICKSVVKV